MLWQRSLDLCMMAFKQGAHVLIEHPAGSKAWQMSNTHAFMNDTGCRIDRVDWCMFHDDLLTLPNKKPTKLLNDAPWLESVLSTCDRSHLHGPPLRGDRAKAAAAYPPSFCKKLAEAYAAWAA
jgi:hypothetical protein